MNFPLATAASKYPASEGSKPMNAATRDTVRAAPDGLAPPREGNDATDDDDEEEGEEEEEEAAGSTAAAAAAASVSVQTTAIWFGGKTWNQCSSMRE